MTENMKTSARNAQQGILEELNSTWHVKHKRKHAKNGINLNHLKAFILRGKCDWLDAVSYSVFYLNWKAVFEIITFKCTYLSY